MIYLFALLIAMVVWFIMVMWLLFTSKRVPKDTVIALTGGLGTGKTLIGTAVALKSYKKLLWLWILGFLKEDKKRVPMPLFYSNIPIKVKMPLPIRLIAKTDKYIWTKKLTYEHLTMVDRINEYSVIFIDELGQFADQYSHDNPFVMQYIQTFIRFYRHFIDGRLVITDQSSSNIVVAVRRRLNVIYNLHDFRRRLLYFYKVSVDPVMISEDMTTFKNASDQDQEHFSGHLPFKWFKFLDISRLFSYKRYDSRCYSPLYGHVPRLAVPEHWEEYKTKYLIDLPNNSVMKKQFRQHGFITQDEMMSYVKDWKKSIGTETQTSKRKEDNA